MSIYSPAEDSYLLNDFLKKELSLLLKKNPNLLFLEIGAGSGINLQTAEKLGVKKYNIFSCDINPEAVNFCTSLGYNSVLSDLFKNVLGKFDLIIFNPPYLPEDFREPLDSKTSTTGGKEGDEIILRFLKQAEDYLNENGKIFLLTSTLTPKIDFEKFGYKAKELDYKSLFYEKLSVWELTKDV